VDADEEEEEGEEIGFEIDVSEDSDGYE